MSSQVACIQCRQQKVRCIGRDENNDRCQRCQKRGLECVVDGKFKRTVKRKAVEILEAEIDQLKAQLASQQVQLGPQVGGIQPRISHVVPQMAAPRFTPPKRVSITPQPAPIPPNTWTCTPKTSSGIHRESLTLESDTIELLFREYVMFYHNVLPVVEVQRGPEFVYDASAALFWTIMAIASRRKSAELPEGIDFERLCEVQKQYLSEIAVSPVLGQGKSSEFNLPSLYAVQAFLLCTLWPPPTSSINADVSWNSVGIALLTAHRAGLHCPGHAKDFERIFKSNKANRSNIREQLVTWLATNALSQAVANMFGYPSAANFRTHREYLYQSLDLPPRVRHMYEIQRNAHDIEESLGALGLGSDMGTTDLNASMVPSLIRIHAERYNRLESRYGAEMDTWTLFMLYAGRAQLFSYYLFSDLQEESALLLYNSCLTLLNHVVLQPDDYLRHLPVVSIMILWQTASVVVKLYFSKWSNNLDKVSGEQLYRLVIKKVSLSSLFEHDLPYRAAEIMIQMWGAFRALARAKNERLLSGTLTLKSRMSASAFFDSLWLLREGTEIRSHAPTNLTKPTPETPIMQIPEVSSSDGTRSASPMPFQSESMGPPMAPPPEPPIRATPGQTNGHSSGFQSMTPAATVFNGHDTWSSEVTPMASVLSPNSPVSPALSAMIDASWSDMGPEAASTIWHDVNSVMEDFGFGLSELPYISP